jgi:hypothetical protein
VFEPQKRGLSEQTQSKKGKKKVRGGVVEDQSVQIAIGLLTGPFQQSVTKARPFRTVNTQRPFAYAHRLS